MLKPLISGIDLGHLYYKQITVHDSWTWKKKGDLSDIFSISIISIVIRPLFLLNVSREALVNSSAEEAKANGGGKPEGWASVEEAEAQASEEEAKEPASKWKRMDKGMRMYKIVKTKNCWCCCEGEEPKCEVAEAAEAEEAAEAAEDV